MRRLFLSTALSVLALPAMAEDAALLLGVERYQEFRRVSGADDLARAEGDLSDAGYAVEVATNESGRDMLPELNRFVAEVADADRLIVALSGRFYSDGDRAWLMASDARDPSLFGMGDTAISVDSLMHVLAQTPGQALLVLGIDEGDSNSLGQGLSQGVGRLDIPQGVSVIVSAPGSVDDVLTEAARDGADLVAYVDDSRRLRMEGFRPASLVMQPDADGPAPRPAGDPTVAAWRDAQTQDTADSYRDFLFQYPDSPYAAEARRKLDEIENDPVRLDRLSEESLNLNRNARRAIQRNLTLLGYNTRGVDGIFGPGSRNAIRNWQQTNGFQQTSFLTREQIDRIDAQARRRAAEIEAEEEREREEALRLDRAYWEETGARGDIAGYRAYLERYPEGAFAEEATQKLNELTGRDREEDQRVEDAQEQERRLNVNPILARLIESRLAQLGFNPGNVDGRFDRDTRRAIARYQTSRNLPSTGYLSEPTLARLLADTFR